MRPPRAHAAARPPARESNKGSGSQSLSLELRSRWSQGPDRLNAGEVRRQAGRLEEGPCLGTPAPRSERGAPRGALAGRQGPWRLVTPSVRPDTLTAGVMRPECTARRAATEGRHGGPPLPRPAVRPPRRSPPPASRPGPEAFGPCVFSGHEWLPRPQAHAMRVAGAAWRQPQGSSFLSGRRLQRSMEVAPWNAHALYKQGPPSTRDGTASTPSLQPGQRAGRGPSGPRRSPHHRARGQAARLQGPVWLPPEATPVSTSRAPVSCRSKALDVWLALGLPGSPQLCGKRGGGAPGRRADGHGGRASRPSQPRSLRRASAHPDAHAVPGN